MRRVLAFMLVVAGCSGGPAAAPGPAEAPTAAPPPAPPAAVAPAAPLDDPHAWTARSADGQAVLTQASAGAGCRLTATLGGAPTWQADGCVASRGDLVFVSPDADLYLVLFPVPEHHGADWSASEVATLYRRGEAARHYVGDELVAAERIGDLRAEFSWLRGVRPGEGAPPRYAPDGKAVVLEVADGATLTLGFRGEGVPGRARKPTPPPAREPVTAAVEQGEPDGASLWSWEDAQGQVHYQRWYELSPEARRRARPVNASVGSMRMEKSVGGPVTAASPAPSAGDRPAGPRVNGLTDAEREAQAQAKADAAAAQRREEAYQNRVRKRRERGLPWDDIPKP
jgi:hypothetical protein